MKNYYFHVDTLKVVQERHWGSVKAASEEEAQEMLKVQASALVDSSKVMEVLVNKTIESPQIYDTIDLG